MIDHGSSTGSASASESSGGTFLYSRMLDLNMDSGGNIWATADKGLIRFSFKKKFMNRDDITPDLVPERFLNIDFFQLSAGKKRPSKILL